MRRMRCGLGFMLVLCLICAGLQALEFPLTYERYQDNRQGTSFRPHGFAQVELMEKAPEGEWKLPTCLSGLPVYGWVKIGEQERLLLMDQTSKTAKFYDRAYFDANANRDLTDDPVVDTQNIQIGNDNQYFRAEFAGIDVQARVGGVSLPYSFSVNVNYWSDQPVTGGSWLKSFFGGETKSGPAVDLRRLNVSVMPNCMFTAKLDLDGAKYSVYLGDGNANGRFDDWGTIPGRDTFQNQVWPQGDNFYLSSGDAQTDYYDGQPLGKYLSLRDTLYAVDISQADKRLTLTPVTDKVAKVELPMPVHRISMISADACVMSCQSGKTILAPAGTYRLLAYMLFRDEPGGARWRLIASGSWDSPEVTVEAGATTAWKLGEPFRPTVSVPPWMRENMKNDSRKDIPEVRLEMAALGAGKEIVSDLTCVSAVEKSKVAMSPKNNNRPKEAAYKILKADGEAVLQGTFEYG